MECFSHEFVFLRAWHFNLNYWFSCSRGKQKLYTMQHEPFNSLLENKNNKSFSQHGWQSWHYGKEFMTSSLLQYFIGNREIVQWQISERCDETLWSCTKRRTINFTKVIKFARNEENERKETVNGHHVTILATPCEIFLLIKIHFLLFIVWRFSVWQRLKASPWASGSNWFVMMKISKFHYTIGQKKMIFR